MRYRSADGNAASHPLDAPMFDRRAPRLLSADEYRVLGAFQSRFDQWWTGAADDHANRMRLGLQSLAADTNLDEALAGLARFFQVDTDAERRPSVQLLSAPGPIASQTNAELRGATAYVETTIGEWPSMRLGVVAHELAHYYYALASAEMRHETRRWFVEHDAPWSVPAYNLFNEAIASAFGGGIVEQRLQTPRQFEQFRSMPESFYADSYVDAAGKALLPLLQGYLDDQRALDRAFVDSYVERLGDRLGERVTDLALWLRTMTLTSLSPELASNSRLLQRRLITGALFEERAIGGCARPCLLQIYPDLAGIVLTLNDDLDDLEAFVPPETVTRIRRNAITRGSTVFGHRRSEKSLLFIVAGASPADVESGLSRLLDHGAIFSGPLAP